MFLFLELVSFSQKIDFKKYFENKTLRLDYIHAGNSDTGMIFLDDLRQEPYWGGSHTNLIDTFNYGEYRVMVYTHKTKKLIYSRGYSTLFEEWQVTPEAKKTNKSFYESVVVPYPKDSIDIAIEQIDKHNKYHQIFRYTVSPKNMFIKKGLKYHFPTYDYIKNGNPANKLDIVFLAEGYKKDQMQKYKNDVKKFVNTLFSYEPFKSHKKDINIHVVESFSADSGTDIPGENIWRNTILNTNFWTFGTERYLTTLDYRTVRDLAALAPYDQIYILVNTDKYGGGGIYNFYNLCVSDNPRAPQVFVHEFGHGFGGLADEYAYGDSSNENTYDLHVEPQAPNITTLVNFKSKWADMVKKGTPIPTPAIPKYKNAVGAFEGAGYVSKGVYRPQQNCLMRSLEYPFCKVCKRAISKMLQFYSE
jgi:hypothetical protein